MFLHFEWTNYITEHLWNKQQEKMFIGVMTINDTYKMTDWTKYLESTGIIYLQTRRNVFSSRTVREILCESGICESII